MKKVKVNEQSSDKLRKTLVLFTHKYGDNHITKKAIQWLKNTPSTALQPENGDLVHVYIENNKIVGMLAIAKYGLDQAFIVVHPSAREKGVAYRLVIEALEDIDRMYVKVANDNIPSLKLCFATGMRAFDLTKGPTGKPTLVLGLGNWNQEEWDYHQKK